MVKVIAMHMVEYDRETTLRLNNDCFVLLADCYNVLGACVNRNCIKVIDQTVVPIK